MPSRYSKEEARRHFTSVFQQSLICFPCTAMPICARASVTLSRKSDSCNGAPLRTMHCRVDLDGIGSLTGKRLCKMKRPFLSNPSHLQMGSTVVVFLNAQNGEHTPPCKRKVVLHRTVMRPVFSSPLLGMEASACPSLEGVEVMSLSFCNALAYLWLTRDKANE